MKVHEYAVNTNTLMKPNFLANVWQNTLRMHQLLVISIDRKLETIISSKEVSRPIFSNVQLKTYDIFHDLWYSRRVTGSGPFLKQGAAQ